MTFEKITERNQEIENKQKEVDHEHGLELNVNFK